MRFLYVKLEGYIGLYNGLGLTELELDLSKCKNSICVISGPNGVGKSTIINALQLFPDSLDNIAPKLNGSKYIRFTDGINIYESYITYPLDKKGNRTQTKASFKKNGDELNSNGNITSYKEIIFNEFDMDANYITLSKISGRNRGIADKTPAERKKLISSLILSLDVYNNIYKNLNKKANIFKSYMNNFADKIKRVGDEQLIRSTLVSLSSKEDRLISIIDDSKRQIVEARTIVSMNDPDGTMQNRYNELTQNLSNLEKIEKESYYRLSKARDKVSFSDSYQEKLESCNSRLIELRAEIDSYDLKKINIIKSIQEISNEIERLNIKIDKLNSEIDPALEESINKYQLEIESIEKGISILGVQDIESVSKNDIDNAILSAIHLVDMIDELYSIMSDRDFKDIKSYYENSMDINEKIKEYEDMIDTEKDNISNMRELLAHINRDKEIISILSDRPSGCKDDTCPFIKEAINTFNKYSNIDDETYKVEYNLNESIKSVEYLESEIIRFRNMINILAKIAMITDIVNLNINNFSKFSVTLGISSVEVVINRICNEDRFNELRNISSIMDISNSLIEYKSIKKILDNLLSDYKIQMNSKNILKEYESEKTTKLAKKDSLSMEIYQIDKDKEFALALHNQIKNDILKLKEVIEAESLWEQSKSNLDNAIAESKLIKDKFDSSLSLLEKINDLEILIKNNNIELDPIRNQKKQIESNLMLLESYKEEYDKYKEKFNFIDVLRKYASPTKDGIQNLFMSMYMDKTLSIVNQILSMIFNGQYRLLKYNITGDSFSIPFIGNGLPVDDISSGSESQVCIMGMAINLSLINISSSKYNIVSMDEIDGGLDHINRYMFVDVLQKIYDILQIGQLFIISHSVESALNNVDVILLSDEQEYTDQFANANIVYQFKRVA